MKSWVPELAKHEAKSLLKRFNQRQAMAHRALCLSHKLGPETTAGKKAYGDYERHCGLSGAYFAELLNLVDKIEDR